MVFEFVNGCAYVQHKFIIIHHIGFDKLLGHADITSLDQKWSLNL